MMKKFVLIFLLASSCLAQTWRGHTSGYLFTTFTGNGSGDLNVFAGAYGTDGITWTGTPASWQDAPWFYMNAIEAEFIDNNLYVMNTCANDHVNCIDWAIGIVNQTDGDTTTLRTVDWGPYIPGASTCFQGGFVRNSDGSPYEGDGYVHLMIPCYSGSWTLYETHSLPTDMVNWTNPIAVSGFTATGMEYDEKIYQIGGTFYAWWTDNSNIQLKTSTALLGPYSAATFTTATPWPSGSVEGPFAYPAPAGSGYTWYIQFENDVSTGSVGLKPLLYYSACNTASFTACTWTTATTQTTQYNFRHGAVLPLSAPVASPAASTPIFSPPNKGVPTGDSFSASISCVTPNATIYYTRDGSTPTTSSPIYSSPYTVSATETDKAICVAPGFQSSLVATAGFNVGTIIRGSTTQSYSTGTTSTINIPAGAQAGDMCIVIATAQNTFSNPSGWSVYQWVSGQPYYGGVFYVRTLTSEDVSLGTFTVTTGSSGAGTLTVVDLIGPHTYDTGNFTQATTAPANTAVPALSTGHTGDLVFYVEGSRSSATGSVSRGALVQASTDGSGTAQSVYEEVLASGYSTGVTYTFGGTFNPQGYYTGWIAIQP